MGNRVGYGFSEMDDLGRIGAMRVMHTLRTYGITENIEDVQHVEEYQEQDVDFIWEINYKGRRQKKKCELKTDTQAHRTGNLFLETVSNTSKGTLGNFLYTTCDYFIYYLIETGKMYFFRMKKLKEWVLANEDTFRVAYGRTDLGYGRYYKSKGLLVPIHEALHNLGPHVFTIESEW